MPTAVRVPKAEARKSPPALQPPPDQAPYDDTRKALSFALNHHQVAPPTAMMNAMMASIRVEEKKRKRKKKKSEAELLGEALLSAVETPEQLLEMEREQAQKKRSNLTRHPSLRSQGLSKNDEAHLAGFILYHFGRLDPQNQEVLSGLLTIPFQPCSCRQPCCSGHRPTERWVAAVRATADRLWRHAEVLKQPGKKGLGTQPLLRQLLIELYFLGGGPSLTDIAGRSGVSLVTAARHRAWIHEWLGATEQAAWEELEAIFDQAGITGPSP